jgi:hypothetical protein
LTFGQTTCSKGALNNLLVSAPVKEIKEGNACEKGAKGKAEVFVTCGVEAFGVYFVESFPTFRDSVVITDCID